MCSECMPRRRSRSLYWGWLIIAVIDCTPVLGCGDHQMRVREEMGSWIWRGMITESGNLKQSKSEKGVIQETRDWRC